MLVQSRRALERQRLAGILGNLFAGLRGLAIEGGPDSILGEVQGILRESHTKPCHGHVKEQVRQAFARDPRRKSEDTQRCSRFLSTWNRGY